MQLMVLQVVNEFRVPDFFFELKSACHEQRNVGGSQLVAHLRKKRPQYYNMPATDNYSLENVVLRPCSQFGSTRARCRSFPRSPYGRSPYVAVSRESEKLSNLGFTVPKLY